MGVLQCLLKQMTAITNFDFAQATNKGLIFVILYFFV